MITIEDALKQIGNRFKLIQVAAKRARKLSVYGSHALVDWGNNSPIIVALREISCGYKFDDKGNYVFRDMSKIDNDKLSKTSVAIEHSDIYHDSNCRDNDKQLFNENLIVSDFVKVNEKFINSAINVEDVTNSLKV
ncbi:MAG: DNA-directed RNA polymerase subunit omega [Candidatus Azosocius agrarius]|nr:MAG: DNA-directed RNA polymerase subunit omega [Gammaproteobacteria bacterium]